MRGLSLVAASGGHSSTRCAGLSLSWPLLLRSTGSRRADSVIVAHGPSCSAACGIFRDQGSNPCPLHWQADSQPLRHQGSPYLFSFIFRSVFLFYFSGRFPQFYTLILLLFVFAIKKISQSYYSDCSFFLEQLVFALWMHYFILSEAEDAYCFQKNILLLSILPLFSISI